MLHEANAGDIIEFAKLWASLGDAITEQVETVVNDPRAAAGLDGRADQEVNSNAIRIAEDRLRGWCEDLDAALAEFWELTATG